MADTDADQFKGRDARGLLPEDKAKTEAQARAFYLKLTPFFVFVLGPLLAAGLHGALVLSAPRQAAAVRAKLDLVRAYDLGYVYIAYALTFVGRVYATINANGARAPARVDRPDQHVYQIMAETGPLAGAPYVLMTTTGAAGRFNRAQRACANMDETLPLFLAGLLLQGLVFGPMAVAVAAAWLVGAVRFAEDYKADAGRRTSGLLLMVLANYASFGLVLDVAFQAFFMG